MQALSPTSPVQAPKLASLSPLKAKTSEPTQADVFSSGQSQASAVVARPVFPTSSDAAAEKPLNLAGLSVASKVGVTMLAGISLMTALTGCTKSTAPAAPAVVETQVQKDARSAFSQSITDMETQMGQMKAGDGHQQAEQFTSQFLNKAGDYAKQVGQGGQVALNGIQTELRDHPAMAATVIFALGAASGIALEHYGVDANIKDGVSNVVDWVNQHRILSIGIGIGAAAGLGVLINNYSSQIASVKAGIPAKPQTVEGKALDANFTQIEDQIKSDGSVDSKTVTTKVLDAVNKYKDKSHKAWSDVANDVKAYAYDHPILAAAVVAGAGTGTGILLEKAGVPKELAGLTEGLLASGQNGASSAIEWAKAHPLVTGAGAAVVAAGVGYLAYEHFHTEAPAAP